MVPCAAIGDSIAVGVGQARPDCIVTAQVGISSDRYITSLLPLAETGADTTIISLGVNDGTSIDTLDNLRQVRRQVRSRTVFWLLPGIKEQVREYIATVAQENGDRLIDTRPEAGRDHLHPNGAGYLQIASQTYGDGGGSYYQSPPPVEVAEAPSRYPAPGESAFHVAYSDLSPRHAGHSASHELYFVNVPRRLSGMATPRERIRNLRAERRAETITFHATHLAMPIPPQPSAPAMQHGLARGAAPASSRVVAHAHANAAPARPSATHASRTALLRPVVAKSIRG